MTKRIQVQLVRLIDGARLLRFSEKTSGLSLEKRTDARWAIGQQKQGFLREFALLLEREVTARLT